MTIRPKRVVKITSGEELTMECWMAEGLDDALIGFGEQAGQTVAVYDCEKCVEIFMQRDGMDRDEAEEHMSYNVAGTYLPGQTPVFVTLETPTTTTTEFAIQQHITRPAGWC